jgi:myo-inositol-1(or 4)-monophosphatase
MQGCEPFLAHLEALFQEVVRALAAEDAGRWQEAGLNAKGDRIRWFDLAAHQAVCAYLERRFLCPVTLLSEEDTPRELGEGKPEYTVVLDPVDGSDNFARGIGTSGMAVALIPASLPISIGTVEYALVGDLFTGDTWLAARGRGAFSNGSLVHTRSVTRPEEAMISCELNHFAVEAPLSGVLSRARGVRVLGCATRALSMVAAGALDAHLDLRGRLTPENFLAPSLILTEAGGSVTDPEGNPLPTIQCLTERHSILAAATPELHAALVQQLKGGHAHEE